MVFLSVAISATDAQTPPAGSLPRKHKPGSSLLESLEALVDQQNKEIESQAKQIEQLAKQVDLQNKQLELQTKQVDLQSKQLETLAGNIARVAQILETSGSTRPAATAPSSPATAEPTVQTPSASPQSETPAPPVATAVEPPPASSGTAVAAVDPDTQTHVVKKGENLTTIAKRANTTVFELLKLNKIEDERKLQIGQVLLLPKSGPPSPSSQPKKDSQ